MKVNEIFNKKRIIAFVMAFAMVVTSLSGISFASKADELDDTTPIHQLYNAKTSDHFFTISDKDAQEAAASYGYTYEKDPYNVPIHSDDPVYCMVCPGTAEHIYSTDYTKLVTWCAEHPGYYMQGDGEVVWFSADKETGVPVYQFFNPNQTADKASHMLAAYGSEDYETLTEWKWQNDGVVFYVVDEEPEDLEIVATQSGTSEVTVASNKPLTVLDEITLTRAGKVQEATVSISEDGYTATLTTTSPIGNAEYTVTVDPADPSLDVATDTFDGEVGQLSALVFLSDKLILLNTQGTTGVAPIIGVNQFGEQVKLSSLDTYCSGGTAVYDPQSNMIMCTSTGVGGFTVGQTVTVNAIYNNGTIVKQATANLEVVREAYVADLEFGELQTTKASLKDKHVTHENLATDTYYLPVLSAEDQYGNKLNKDMLNAMLNGTYGNQTLYITPNNDRGVFAYAGDFEELEDGTPILKIGDGALTLPGTQMISIVSVGGFQDTETVTVEDTRYIADLTVTVPELYSGVEAEFSVSAVDQYGEVFTPEELYKYAPTLSADKKKLTFTDTNNLTQSHSSLSVQNGTFSVEKNAAKKTFTIKYTPVAALTADAKDILGVTTLKVV